VNTVSSSLCVEDIQSLASDQIVWYKQTYLLQRLAVAEAVLRRENMPDARPSVLHRTSKDDWKCAVSAARRSAPLPRPVSSGPVRHRRRRHPGRRPPEERQKPDPLSPPRLNEADIPDRPIM